MGKKRLALKLSLTILLLTLLAGCATQPTAVRRFYWPPLPAPPRIEWLGAYHSQLDLKTPSFLSKILGEEEPIALDKPLYIAANGAGKVYVGDIFKSTFWVYDLKEKDVYRLGANTAHAVFEHPTGIDLDGEGNIYAADNRKKKIVVFDRNERTQTVFDLSAEVQTISAIAIDPVRRRLIVPDGTGHKVAVFDLAGKLLFSFGKPGDGDGEFNYPLSAAVNREGEIFIADTQNARIQRFTPDGKFVLKFGQRGDGPSDFAIIKGVAIDSENHVYVTDGKAHNIKIFDDKGDYLLTIGGPYSLQPEGKVAPGGFLIPQGIYIDKNDTIYVVDQLNRRFQVFQYLTPAYLKEHPITELTPAAETPGGPAAK